MAQPLRVLIAEDNPDDAELIVRELKRAGFEPEWERVETEADYAGRLSPDLDVVLSDYCMPQFSASRALQLLQQSGYDLPFIIVSGTIGEETAVAAMKLGATDYLLKDRLARLGPAVELGLRQRALREEGERAQEAMRQSEHKYRHLFESLSEAAFLIECSLRRIVDANLCAENLLGMTRSEILGMDQGKLFPPDDSAKYSHQLDSATVRTPHGQSQEAALLTKDGRHVPVRIGVAPIELHGRKFLLALMTDITEAKQAEERIRQQAALLHHARDAIIVFGLGGEIQTWNPSATRLFGWEAVVGFKIQTLIFSDEATYRVALEGVLSKGDWIGEIAMRTKSGGEVLLESRWTLVRDDTGQPRSILSINTDITERRKLEAQFLRAQRLESIGMLAGGIAHDLNNILGPIIMSAELLKMNRNQPPKPALLETIETSAARGAEMVKHVLGFARGLEDRRVIVHPSDLFSELRTITRETFPKSINVRTVVDDAVWNVAGDPTQLHQLLLNLAVNARDAMSGGGTLSFAARNVEIDGQFAAMQPEARPGSYVVMEVADTGAGIPAGVIDRIFDPFFTTKEHGKGTGLGLSTCAAIVKSHDGFLTVESQPGTGTIFRIHLPAQVDDSGKGVSAELDELPRGNGELVLVVDDEAALRSITRQTLETFGYRVMTADDGAEGVALFAQHAAKISLVLVDLMMPVMNGAAAARAILRLDPAAKIIGATGLAPKGAEFDFSNAGVRHFLPKPYTAGAMLQMIRSILHAEEPAGR